MAMEEQRVVVQQELRSGKWSYKTKSGSSSMSIYKTASEAKKAGERCYKKAK